MSDSTLDIPALIAAAKAQLVGKDLCNCFRCEHNRGKLALCLHSQQQAQTITDQAEQIAFLQRRVDALDGKGVRS